MVKPGPSHLRIRTYNVGFGDCLLITLTYPVPLDDQRTERHVLIDFGSKVRADGGPSVAAVAGKIAEHCGGKLDLIVVSHRHQDHLSGFGSKQAKKHLDGLSPSRIVRPWTDMPEATRKQPGHDLDADSLGFLSLLDSLDERNADVDLQFAGDDRVLAERAKALAALGIKNPDAVAMLENWVAPEHCRWVRADDVLDDLEDVLPGVELEVLGPPTLLQAPLMTSYASSSTEYWLGMLEDHTIEPALMAPVAKDELLPSKLTVAEPAGLGRASWLLDRLHEQGPRQVLEIVEGFEDVLNNTSVVLLMRVADRTLLLAGDAQVENWSYTLDRALGTKDAKGEDKKKPDRALRRKLASVDVYKVGHHGSRNATPRRLVDLWRTERGDDRPLWSVLSTRVGTYGSTAEGEVPKPELVEALEALGAVHSTQALPAAVWWFDIETPATGAAPVFAYTPGPAQI